MEESGEIACVHWFSFHNLFIILGIICHNLGYHLRSSCLDCWNGWFRKYKCLHEVVQRVRKVEFLLDEKVEAFVKVIHFQPVAKYNLQEFEKDIVEKLSANPPLCYPDFRTDAPTSLTIECLLIYKTGASLIKAKRAVNEIILVVAAGHKLELLPGK